MARVLAIPLAALLAAAVLLDPYTWVPHASDYVPPVPWWRTPLALADAALLLAAAGLLWARRPRAAWRVLAAELAYALAVGLGVVHRGALADFLLGVTFPFDARRVVALYLASFALRLLLLATVRVFGVESPGRAP